MKQPLAWIAVVVILATVAGGLGWALYATGGVGASGPGLFWVWVIFIGGVLVTGGLTGLFMWLAFYSARRGYDDRVDTSHFERHDL